MKRILIPTNNCITIAPNFDNANGFRILTSDNGVIKEDCYVKVEDGLDKKYSYLVKEIESNNIENNRYESKVNRLTVILNSISRQADAWLQKNNFGVYQTDETYIINALNAFVEKYPERECDYCCCP